MVVIDMPVILQSFSWPPDVLRLRFVLSRHHTSKLRFCSLLVELCRLVPVGMRPLLSKVFSKHPPQLFTQEWPQDKPHPQTAVHMQGSAYRGSNLAVKVQSCE